MDETLLQTAEPNFHPNEIAGDVFCPSCQYNLRGLNPSGLCPECGAPIENAVNRVSLWNTDRKWVKAQRDGVALALAAFMAEVIHFFMASAFFFIPIQLIGSALVFASAWRLIPHNTDPRLKTPAATARMIIRITAWLEVVRMVLPFLGLLSPLMRVSGLWFIFQLGSFVGFQARAYYFIQLARCFRDPGFQKRITRGLIAGMVGLPGSVTLFYLTLIMGIGIFPFSGSNPGPVAVILAIAAAAASVVSCIWYITALIRLSARLTQVLQGRHS